MPIIAHTAERNRSRGVRTASGRHARSLAVRTRVRAQRTEAQHVRVPAAGGRRRRGPEQRFF